MAEQTIWSGTSSQWKNFGVFFFCLILIAAIVFASQVTAAGPLVLALLVLPLAWMLGRWLSVRSTTYRLTNERLLTERGILSKTTDTLELYRVRDIQVGRPFILRLVGLQNLQLMTSDTSTPRVVLDSIPSSANLADLFREHVEQSRVRKGVRELDVE